VRATLPYSLRPTAYSLGRGICCAHLPTGKYNIEQMPLVNRSKRGFFLRKLPPRRFLPWMPSWTYAEHPRVMRVYTIAVSRRRVARVFLCLVPSWNRAFPCVDHRGTCGAARAPWCREKRLDKPLPCVLAARRKWRRRSVGTVSRPDRQRGRPRDEPETKTSRGCPAKRESRKRKRENY